MTTVREASPGDAVEIDQVSCFLGYAQGSFDESKHRLKKLLASSTDIIWVCEDGTKILDWMHIFIALRPGFAPGLSRIC